MGEQGELCGWRSSSLCGTEWAQRNVNIAQANMARVAQRGLGRGWSLLEATGGHPLSFRCEAGRLAAGVTAARRGVGNRQEGRNRAGGHGEPACAYGRASHAFWAGGIVSLAARGYFSRDCWPGGACREDGAPVGVQVMCLRTPAVQGVVSGVLGWCRPSHSCEYNQHWQIWLWRRVLGLLWCGDWHQYPRHPCHGGPARSRPSDAAGRIAQPVCALDGAGDGIAAVETRSAV